MVSRLRSKEIVDLGRRLVAQLDRKDDLLASWMSHYIAELIDNVEKAPAELRTAAQQACAHAIVELWRRRSVWPEDLRPFAKLEPILATLASLGPERPNWRYYARERNAALANADEETRKWLRFADDIDDSARFLIGSAVRAAAAGFAASVTPWAELAEGADLNNVEYSVLEFIRNALESEDEARIREATLRLSLAQVEAFLKVGAEFADELRTHLDGEFSSLSLFSSLPLFARFSMFESVEADSAEETERVRRMPIRREL